MDKEKINPIKMQYEAEVTVIKSKLGDIEEIRSELGLSQRKISQLLMVDPSAWTRWIHKKTPVPPHIYRSLQWYMALIEKSPEWHPQNSFMRGFQGTNHKAIKMELKEHEERMNQKIVGLQYEQILMEKKHKNRGKMNLLLAGLIFLQALTIIFLIFKAFPA